MRGFEVILSKHEPPQAYALRSKRPSRTKASVHDIALSPRWPRPMRKISFKADGETAQQGSVPASQSFATTKFNAAIDERTAPIFYFWFTVG